MSGSLWRVIESPACGVVRVLIYMGKNVWVIRVGKGDEADDLFSQKNIIALVDCGFGDLRKIQSDRETFYQIYRSTHPGETQASIAGIGGKYYRFVHEANVGDLALYPSRKDKQVYVGEIIGQYTYSPETEPHFPHQRSVSWFFNIHRNTLSEFALRELNAAKTFFQFKTHEGEIRELLRVRSPESSEQRRASLKLGSNEARRKKIVRL